MIPADPSPPQAALETALRAALGPQPGGPVGIAVSGGGDSMALMVLMAEWAARHAIALAAVSVNHGLRPECGAEIAAAAALAARLGLAHDTLHWQGARARGNLMDAARQARRSLIAAWAQGRGVQAVALGHTLEDQAETLLMRIARGSGVDGLAGMAPARRWGGITWLRPLLTTRREALREVLRGCGADWAEDPTNADPRFARARTRRAMAQLGLDPARLARSAGQMAQARDALSQAALDAGGGILRMQAGDALLDRAGLEALPQELRERLVAQLLCALSGQPYRPRLQALRRALAAPTRATLHGCLLTWQPRTLRIAREWKAVAGLCTPVDALWDGRWRLHPPPGTPATGHSIRALGRAIDRLPVAAAPTLPQSSLMASPAVWRGTELVAAPLADPGSRWRASCRQGPLDLLRGALSH